MTGKAFLAGVALLATGLIFVTGGAAATAKTVTLTVNSTADSTTPCTIAKGKSTGTCTLRGAILAANALQKDNTMFVIKLAAKTYNLNQGPLNVAAATANVGNLVQIVGMTAGKKKTPASVINGSGNVKYSSVFVINSPTQMLNVVITGGSGDTGGGVWMDSALDLENSIVRHNTACKQWTGNTCDLYADGGGIFLGGTNSVTPHLSLYKTTVTGNVGNYGGGIANENHHHTSVFILSSHIDKNIACDAFSNGVCVGGGGGGGIYEDGESLTIDNSTVNGNVAGSPAYDVNNDESYGGGIYLDSDAFQLRHSIVSGNVAGQFGGGIYTNKTADIVDSTISHNLAGSKGGGIYQDYLLTSKGATIASNTAGGTFACTINGGSTTCKHTTNVTTGLCATLYPTATACLQYNGYGGGLFSDSEYPQLVSSTVTKNLAVTLSGTSNCTGGQGGGIYSSWTLTMLAGTQVTENTADCGGGIYNYYGGSGSLLYTFDLANSTMWGNSALEDGGAIWTAGPGSGTLYGMKIFKNHAGRQTGGVWDNQLGSVILGVGNAIAKNTSTGACKNITQPCK